MEMMDLCGKIVKIGKTSITCKKENGKTAGIVKNIRTFETVNKNQEVDFYHIARRIGLWGSMFDINTLILDINNNFYFLNNLRYVENYKKYFHGKDGFENEQDNFAKYESILEKAKEFCAIVDCYIQ